MNSPSSEPTDADDDAITPVLRRFAFLHRTPVKVAGSSVDAAGRATSEAWKAIGRVSGESVRLVDIFAREPFWQAWAVIAGALALHLTLPEELVVEPRWIVPSLEILLIGALYLDRPRPTRRHSRRDRAIVAVILAFVAIANFVTIGMLVRTLLHDQDITGYPLLRAAVIVWVTNVMVFALWFWQLDRGGPDARANEHDNVPDFSFPQMNDPAWRGWHPAFIDYLYLAFTNSTALSPTDSMPMTGRAKLLMLVQSLASLITVLLVAARAVNILN